MSTTNAAPWRSGTPWIIAEVGVNHNGDPKLAHELVRIAADCGADAVKFQTFRAEDVASAAAAQAPYQRRRAASDSQLAMLRSLELPESEWERLKSAAEERGLEFLSTAFDERSLRLLERLDPVAHKVPSGELTNHAYLRSIAATGRPTIVSTGMASAEEVAGALEVLDHAAPVALLHCVTSYPAPAESLNLRSIPYLRERFGLDVGWSDHTTTNESALIALGLGATIFERHLTIDRNLPGPDHAASATPGEFESYVRSLRDGWRSLGVGGKFCQEVEIENRTVARRSWHASVDLAAGTTLAPQHVRALRPERGVRTGVDVVGRTLRRAVAAGEPIMEDDLEDRDA